MIYNLSLPTGIVCENLTYFLLLFVLSMYIRFVAKRAESKSSTSKLTAASSGVLLAVQLHFKGAEFNLGFGLNLRKVFQE